MWFKYLLVGLGIALLIWLGSGVALFALFRSAYKVKNGRVYYHTAGIAENEVVGADAQSFEVFRQSDGNYSRDHKSVFFKERQLQGADPASFQPISFSGYTYWGKDKSRVYNGADEIVGADPKSFQLIDTSYSRDATAIFYHQQKVQVKSVASFRLIGEGYATDEEQVFYSGTTMPGVLAKTFVLIPTKDALGTIAFDGQRYYRDGLEVRKNGDTYEDLSQDPDQK